MATNAELFTDALAARRWHLANNPHGQVPADLEMDAIRSRHLTLGNIAMMETGGDRHGSLPTLLFVDDSTAVRLKADRWVAT